MYRLILLLNFNVSPLHVRLLSHVVGTARAADEIRKRLEKMKLPVPPIYTIIERPWPKLSFPHGYYADVIIYYDSILFFFYYFLKNNFFLLKETTKMIMAIRSNTRSGMNFIVNFVFNDKIVLCPTSQKAQEVFEKTKLTCVTLDGYVVNWIFGILLQILFIPSVLPAIRFMQKRMFLMAHPYLI